MTDPDSAPRHPPAATPGAVAAAGGGAEPRRRLHPLSPLLHSAKVVAPLLAIVTYQGAAELGYLGFLGILVVAMCLVTAYSVVTWLVTGYHVVGRELRIHDGVFVRRTRAIPLERLQAVEVVRPLLARLSGLAELRLEVVGHGKTEAPLAYLTVTDAAALRERLLTLATRAGAPASESAAPAGGAEGPADAAAPPTADPGTAATGAPVPHEGAGADTGASSSTPHGAETGAAPSAPPTTASPAVTGPPERPLHAVVNRDVVIGQILTPQVLFLPLAVSAVVAQYLFGSEGLSFVVLLSMAVAIAGVVQQPVRRVMSDWNFRLAMQAPPPGKRHARLRVRHGLTETRSQTVPLHRVHAIGVTWPLLWRRRGWLHCHLDVAGYGTPQQDGLAGADRLLPVGDLDTGRRLTAEVLPGVDLTDLPLAGAPRRARWLDPLDQPVLGAALGDQVFAVRDGRITRRLIVAPYLRMQGVRLTQGPIQRLLRVANVVADTAGSQAVVARHRDLADARALAVALTERARAARAADEEHAEEHQRAYQQPPDPPDGGPAT